jgi:hypothetical protein
VLANLAVASFGGPVRAAVAGAAERAAAPIGVSGNKTAYAIQQQLDSVLAGCGEACAQAGHAPPVWWLLQEPGCHALVLQVPPVLDDADGEVTDLGRGQGVRVGDETADEVVTQPGREDSEELRDGVLVAADDQRLCPAGPGGPVEQRGGVAVNVAGKLDDALLDSVCLQAIPAAEAVATT